VQEGFSTVTASCGSVSGGLVDGGDDEAYLHERGSYEYCDLPVMAASSLCAQHYLNWRNATKDWRKLLDAGEEKQQ